MTLAEHILRQIPIAALLVNNSKLCISDRQIALPSGIVGVGLGETVGNGDAVH